MLLQKRALLRGALFLRRAKGLEQGTPQAGLNALQPLFQHLVDQRCRQRAQASLERLHLALDALRAALVIFPLRARARQYDTVVRLDPALRSVGGDEDGLEAIVVFVPDRLELV